MNLREARIEKGYTQKELAQLLNISRTTYNKYENNSSKPDINLIVKIAVLLEVSTDFLLDFNTNLNPENDILIESAIYKLKRLSGNSIKKALDYMNMLYTIEKINDK